MHSLLLPCSSSSCVVASASLESHVPSLEQWRDDQEGVLPELRSVSKLEKEFRPRFLQVSVFFGEIHPFFFAIF
jgi:hypothetical protein